MGVPKFYRWLSERYPQINQQVEAHSVPDVDNFYLDMNGIIHNCTHGNDVEKTRTMTESDMVVKIFHYIDRLVHIIRPKKLIFLAVDGVAPRAKVNQQRSRRFKTGRERLEAEEAARRRGDIVSDDAFDSNCITPGTPFLSRIDKHLRFFVRKKMSEDPLWQKPQVMLSGPLVPGEGEHKIMEYLRWAKRSSTFEPNLRHCLYGLDADLIMLALVTHEPHFFLLREVVTYGAKGRGRPTRDVLENPCAENFTLMQIGLLREYFALEFKELDLPFKLDVERVIDDFVLLCMLVGNDFLPTLPTLDIAEGALNTVLSLYKELLSVMDGYLHESGILSRKRFEIVLRRAGVLEKEVLELRAIDADHRESRMQRSQKRNKEKSLAQTNGSNGNQQDGFTQVTKQATMMSKEARQIIFTQGNTGLDLWKERYYKLKLNANSESEQRQITQEYIKGIEWVLQYYYRGVVSWEWFYPYHYAPMASEIVNLASLSPSKFEYGKPFNPFQQLLAVMPSSSHKLLPPVYQELMLKPTSPLRQPIDYFPSDFDVDLEGKKADYEGVVLIPFIDERVLLAAEQGLNMDRLSADELERNQHGSVLTFVYDESSTEKLFCDSTLPGRLSSLTQCKSRLLMVSPPPPFPADEKGFVGSLNKKTRVGLSNPVGYPTFESLRGQIKGTRLDTVGVNVFGNPSKKESLVMELRGMNSVSAPFDKIAKVLLGERCWVDWPYLSEAVISGISHESGHYDSDGFRNFSNADHNDWEKDTEHCVERYVTKKGIDVGDSAYFAHVKMCKGMTMMPDGSIEKHFENEESLHPLQTILKENPFQKRGENLATTVEKKIIQDLKSGTQVLYVGHTYYGCMATILPEMQKLGKTLSTTKLRLQLAPHHASEGTNATTSKRMILSFETRYTNEGTVVKTVGLSYRTLGMLCGTINAKDSAGKDLPLGLCLKSKGQEAVVSDYCKRIPGEKVSYGYSRQAIDVLQQYKKRFPWVIAAIEKESRREYAGEDFFPGEKAEVADMHMHSVVKWLKQLPLARRPMVKETAQIASEESIKALQQAIIPPPNLPTQSIYLENVSPNSVLLPLDPSLPKPYILSLNRFTLGDRVVHVGSKVDAPAFGSLGSVVGVHPNGALEVVFDKEFSGGKDLYGKCREGFGCTLSQSSLLNMSQPSFQNTDKAKAANRTIRKKTPNAATVRKPNLKTNPPKNAHSDHAENGVKKAKDAEKDVKVNLIPKDAGQNLLKLLQKDQKEERKEQQGAQESVSAEAEAGRELLRMLQKSSLESKPDSNATTSGKTAVVTAPPVPVPEQGQQQLQLQQAPPEERDESQDLEAFWKSLQQQHLTDSGHRMRKSGL